MAANVIASMAAYVSMAWHGGVVMAGWRINGGVINGSAPAAAWRSQPGARNGYQWHQRR